MSSPTADPLAIGHGDIDRRARRYALWRRRSRQIHAWRRILPALIGLVVLILLGFALYNTVAWRFLGEENERVSIRMMNPKFYGRTGDDVPYMISARSAARDDRDFARVILDQPVFIQNLDLPSQTTLRAATGVYREDTRVLTLDKNLVLTDRRGYDFKGHTAVVDTGAGKVTSDADVAGTGPLGQIAASSYAVSDRGDRITFRGKVKSRILPSQDR